METLFDGIYKGKNVLVTGHTGFKGSWLAFWLTRMGANVTGYSLAPDTDPSHHALLAPGFTSVIADLDDTGALRQVFSAARPDIVFHLAAQPRGLLRALQAHERGNDPVLR